jgi:hypothetical protein
MTLRFKGVMGEFDECEREFTPGVPDQLHYRWISSSGQTDNFCWEVGNLSAREHLEHNQRGGFGRVPYRIRVFIHPNKPKRGE